MSTVHICLKDILGVAVKCEVIFYPGDTPFQNGAAMAVSGRRSVWLDAGGQGSVQLLAGRYAVRFGGIAGNTDALIIEVPDDSGAHEFVDLVSAGNWILPMRDMLQKAKNFADVADAAAAFTAIKQPASTAASGAVQLATQAEVDAGSDAAKAVTPATLAAASALASLTSSVAAKADASALTALASTVTTKADASVVTALVSTVAAKADATALATKADVSALPKTVTVANAAGLLALGSGDVKTGDLVTVTAGDSGNIEYYQVIDMTQLGGYAAFSSLRGGPLFADAGRIQSSNQGGLLFNAPDGATRMRVSSSEYLDGIGLYAGAILFETDSGEARISTATYNVMEIAADVVAFNATEVTWPGTLLLGLKSEVYPMFTTGTERLYIQTRSASVGSFRTDGLYLDKSAGYFGSSPVTTQPSAIANATDLASAITAINALLAAVRKYGMIAS